MGSFQDWFINCVCGNASQVEIELHTDYRKKVTPLYKAIETSQWASVNNFLKTGYWKNSFFADPISPEIQVKTWMVRYEDVIVPVPNKDDNDHGDDNVVDEDKDSSTVGIVDGDTITKEKPKSVVQKTITKKQICWKQLPIHAAVVYNAPAIIIQKLIQAYPKALRCGDNMGNLPIHLAFRHDSNDAILALLLQEYPEGINCRENNGLLPTDCATQLPSPQPLRGALLKTAMSSPRNTTNNKDKNGKQVPVQTEGLFFDDRPITPHRDNRTKTATEGKESKQLSMISDQMESLRNTVSRALSRQESKEFVTNLEEIQQQKIEQQLDAYATEQQQKQQMQQQMHIPPPISTSNPPHQRTSTPAYSTEATPPMSPCDMESLQEIVSQTLAGFSYDRPLKLQDEDNVSALSPNNQSTTATFTSQNQNNNNNSKMSYHQHLLHSGGSKLQQQNNVSSTIDNNNNNHVYPSMSFPQNSLLDSPRHSVTFSDFPQQQQTQQYGPQLSNNHSIQQQHRPQLPNNHSFQQQHQYPPPSPQHQMPQQDQYQMMMQIQNTATFEEQQRRLDNEVKLMEEKMAYMEKAMKEMHKREKTVRQELAMTMEEVQHWKEQTKKAKAQKEKNRILREMLQEFAVSAMNKNDDSSPASPEHRTIQQSRSKSANTRKSSPRQGRSRSPRRQKYVQTVADDDSCSSDEMMVTNIIKRDKGGLRSVMRQKNQQRYARDEDSQTSEVLVEPPKPEAPRDIRRTKSGQRMMTESQDSDNEEFIECQDERDDRHSYAHSGVVYERNVPGIQRHRRQSPDRKRGSNNKTNKHRQGRNSSNDDAPVMPRRKKISENTHRDNIRSVSFVSDDEEDTAMAQAHEHLARRSKSYGAPQRGRLEPKAGRVAEIHRRRSYADPPIREPFGSHVESSSYVPGMVVEDEETTEFSRSLMEKMSSLRSKQNKTPTSDNRFWVTRQAEEQHSGVWSPRDPSVVGNDTYYHLIAKYDRPDRAGSAESASSRSDSDFYPRD